MSDLSPDPTSLSWGNLKANCAQFTIPRRCDGTGGDNGEGVATSPFAHRSTTGRPVAVRSVGRKTSQTTSGTDARWLSFRFRCLLGGRPLTKWRRRHARRRRRTINHHLCKFVPVLLCRLRPPFPPPLRGRSAGAPSPSATAFRYLFL